MTKRTRILSYEGRIRAFWMLVAVAVITLGIYMYGVNSAVRNTALREKLETESENLAVELSEKEFTYIALKNDISLDLAYERGFKDVSKPVFITRTKGALGMNVER